MLAVLRLERSLRVRGPMGGLVWIVPMDQIKVLGRVDGMGHPRWLLAYFSCWVAYYSYCSFVVLYGVLEFAVQKCTSGTH
jgi:hypothetical protein